MNKQEIIDVIVNAIKEQYGVSDYGCYVNGEWLSTKEIIDIIKETIKNNIYL